MYICDRRPLSCIRVEITDIHILSLLNLVGRDGDAARQRQASHLKASPVGDTTKKLQENVANLGLPPQKLPCPRGENGFISTILLLPTYLYPPSTPLCPGQDLGAQDGVSGAIGGIGSLYAVVVVVVVGRKWSHESAHCPPDVPNMLKMTEQGGEGDPMAAIRSRNDRGR